MDYAKRVILRIREADVNWTDQFEPVRLYLEKKGHSSEETTTPWNNHFVHLQPPSDIPQQDPKIHIIIDLNKARFSKTFVDDEVPHEMYRIRYVDNKMDIFHVRHAENMIKAVREFTDGLYPWGEDMASLRRGRDTGQP